MHSQLDTIRNLHQELVAALDSGDVDLVVELVQQREAAVTSLQQEYQAANPATRRTLQPDLAALLPLDRDLQTRAGGLRDHLQTELDDQRSTTPRRERQVVSGVFDRQA